MRGWNIKVFGFWGKILQSVFKRLQHYQNFILGDLQWSEITVLRYPYLRKKFRMLENNPWSKKYVNWKSAIIFQENRDYWTNNGKLRVFLLICAGIKMCLQLFCINSIFLSQAFGEAFDQCEVCGWEEYCTQCTHIRPVPSLHFCGINKCYVKRINTKYAFMLVVKNQQCSINL